MSHSWNRSLCLGGGGEPGSPQGLQAGRDCSCLPQQPEVTWCVAALGAPGPQPGVWKTHSWGGRAWRAKRVGLSQPPLGPSQRHGEELCVGHSLGLCHFRQWPPTWEFERLGPWVPQAAAPAAKVFVWGGALLNSVANGLGRVLEGAGTIVPGTIRPGSLYSLGRWGGGSRRGSSSRLTCSLAESGPGK